MILVLLWLGALLLLANAAFVAAEFAFVGAQRSRLQRLAQSGDRRAPIALSIVAVLPSTLATTQLGITMASVGLGMTAEAALEDATGPVEEALRWLPDPLLVVLTAALSLGLVTLLHTVLGEMVPKNLAIAAPERTALWLATPVRLLETMMSPAVTLLAGTGELLLRTAGIEPRREISAARTTEDIAAVLGSSRLAGAIVERDARLATAAIRFAAAKVESVMRDITAMRAVPERCSIHAVEQLAASTGHLSLPVYRTTPGRIVGVVRVHDVLGSHPDERLSAELIRPVLRVPRSLRLTELLNRMRATGVHVAMVTENGTAVGMLTLPDLLDALTERR